MPARSDRVKYVRALDANDDDALLQSRAAAESRSPMAESGGAGERTGSSGRVASVNWGC